MSTQWCVYKSVYWIIERETISGICREYTIDEAEYQREPRGFDENIG